MWNDFLFQVQNPRDLATVNRGRFILGEIFSYYTFCVGRFLLALVTIAC